MPDSLQYDVLKNYATAADIAKVKADWWNVKRYKPSAQSRPWSTRRRNGQRFSDADLDSAAASSKASAICNMQNFKFGGPNDGQVRMLRPARRRRP